MSRSNSDLYIVFFRLQGQGPEFEGNQARILGTKSSLTF